MNQSKADPRRATENDLHRTASSVEYNPTGLTRLGPLCHRKSRWALSIYGVGEFL